MKRWRTDKIMISLLLPVILLAVIKPLPVEAHPLAAEFDCTAQTSIPTDQCDALTTIYDETGGDDWLNQDGWKQAEDPCQWYGVTCFEGTVVALDLFGNNLTGTLPLEIGGFPDLKTLTINGNSLTGPIPLTITFMDLDLFHFHNTSLCEPANPAFQDWLSQIVYRLSSGIYCSPLAPTETPIIAQTQTEDDLPWPQQTLTALAAESNSVLGSATQEPTPTKYYTLESPTPEIVEAGQGDTFGMGETAEKIQSVVEQPSFFDNIPRGWLVVLTVPVVLIVIGIFLELRDRRREREETQPTMPLDYGDFEDRL